jgi:hypothetical protein
MGLELLLLDNPILTKHRRARLRPAQALPQAVIVLAVSASIAWAGQNIPWIGNVMAEMLLLGFQVMILGIGGSNQINASLGGARASGNLAFHRVSPLAPAVVALGFFLGAPIREYALAAITLPFAAFTASVLGSIDPWSGLFWLARLEAVLLLSIWLVHAVTMLGCLTRKKPLGSIQGTAAMLILLFIVGTYGSFGFYFGALYTLKESPRLNFFGAMIPWLAWIVIYAAPALGFLGLAVTRKMRAERTHAFSKLQALALMTTLTVLVLGGLWQVAQLLPPTFPSEFMTTDMIMLAAVYVLSLVALVLAGTVTPRAGEYTKAVRRAVREGRRRPGPLTDAGSNRLAVVALSALVLAGATAVVNVVGREPLEPQAFFMDWSNRPAIIEQARLSDEAWLASRQELLSRPIVVGVLTVAYGGFALQYFSLLGRRAGLMLLTLLFFAAWIAPVLVGAIAGLSRALQAETALVVLALSPIFGIVLSSGLGDPPGAEAIQLAALAPPVTLAFFFKYLVIVAQRNIDRQVRSSAKLEAPESATGDRAS